MKARKNSNIIIAQEAELKNEVGGIVLPDCNRLTCSQIAVVYDHGDGISEDEKKAMQMLKKGTYILVEKGAGQIVENEDKKYLFMDIGQVFGIIKQQ